MLWGRLLEAAKGFETRADAEAARDGVGETILYGQVKKKAIGSNKHGQPIVIVDLEDGRRFFLENTGDD